MEARAAEQFRAENDRKVVINFVQSAHSTFLVMFFLR